jgi:hypothetical protein
VRGDCPVKVGDGSHEVTELVPGNSPVAECLGIIGPEPHRLVKILQRPGELALISPRWAPPDERLEPLGVMAESGVELFDRPVRLTCTQPVEALSDQALGIRRLRLIDSFHHFTHDPCPRPSLSSLL